MLSTKFQYCSEKKYDLLRNTFAFVLIQSELGADPDIFQRLGELRSYGVEVKTSEKNARLLFIDVINLFTYKNQTKYASYITLSLSFFSFLLF